VRTRLLLAATLVNALGGTLFAWGLLLAPLRQATGLSLAALSLVPALALVGFTLGMLLHHRLLACLAPAALAAGLLLLAAAGHALFLAWPGYPALLLGYGALFGLANGVGYGLAVALARAAAPPGASGSGPVGLPIAAYAAPGIVFSALALRGSAPADAAAALGQLALLLAIGAIVAALLLLGRPRLAVATAAAGPRPRLLRFGLGFFALCCPGLAFVAHATSLLAGKGLIEAAPAAPLLFNAGYLAGALLAGTAARRATPRGAYLLALLVAAAAGPLVLLLPGAPASLAALALLGASLGSSAALLLLLLLERLGAAAAAPAFGRLMLAYGAAGLLAPSLTGLLRDWTGGFGAAVALLAAVALFGAALLARLPAVEPLPSDRALR
jgi:OFA family oxalate/formate antiporter-like MFS transporter